MDGWMGCKDDSDEDIKRVQARVRVRLNASGTSMSMSKSASTSIRVTDRTTTSSTLFQMLQPLHPIPDGIPQTEPPEEPLIRVSPVMVHEIVTWFPGM